MNLSTKLVVNVHMLLLSYGKKFRIILQVLDIVNGFSKLELAAQFAFFPIERGDMALSAT